MLSDSGQTNNDHLGTCCGVRKIASVEGFFPREFVISELSVCIYTPSSVNRKILTVIWKIQSFHRMILILTYLNQRIVKS